MGRELLVSDQIINLDDLIPFPKNQYRPMEEIIVMGRDILMGHRKFNVDELLSSRLSTTSQANTSGAPSLSKHPPER